MGLDIRLPIGLMFATFSPILMGTGYLTHTPINLYSGAAMGVFASGMLALSYFGQDKT